MSFQKAADPLRLAEMATSRYAGVTLTDTEDTFAVGRRTTQRMTKALAGARPAESDGGGRSGTKEPFAIPVINTGCRDHDRKRR